LLIEEDETAPITLFFNSPGGLLDDAYRLIDYIDGSETPFIGVATQLCGSAAAQIFASLSNRLIMPHARIMIHQPLQSTLPHINSSNLESMSKILKGAEHLVYLDLAKWTNQEVEKIAADCAKETCLT
jgi:ATP-dependent Clp protease protease subunit